MLNKIIAKTHQIQIKNSNFGRETNQCNKMSIPHAYAQQNFRIFRLGCILEATKKLSPILNLSTL